MTTPTASLNNSRVLFGTKKELDYACRKFEFSEGRIKTMKLKLNNPGFGTPENCCWTTLAKIISDFYNNELPAEKKEEKIRNCGLENMEIFDYGRFNRTDNARGLNNHFGKQINTYLSQAYIMKEINKKRPVCICIKWEGTNEVHAVIVYGYSLTPDSFILHIADPWDSEHDVNYVNFGYLYRANWTSSYLTA